MAPNCSVLRLLAANNYGAIPLLFTKTYLVKRGNRRLAIRTDAPRPVEDSAGPKLQLTWYFRCLEFQHHAACDANANVHEFSTVIYGTDLIVRIYDGTAIEISFSTAFVFSTMTSAVLWLWPAVYVGRDVTSGDCGLSLSIGLLEPPFWGFLTSIFLWGMGGGVAMSMSRTIMQENAPDDMRARVLAVFTLSNTGGMPIGALALGYFTEFFGILSALAFVILGVWISSAPVTLLKFSRIGS